MPTQHQHWISTKFNKTFGKLWMTDIHTGTDMWIQREVGHNKETWMLLDLSFPPHQQQCGLVGGVFQLINERETLSLFCRCFWALTGLSFDLPLIEVLSTSSLWKQHAVKLCKWTITEKSVPSCKNVRIMSFTCVRGCLCCLFPFFYGNKVLQPLVFALSIPE